MKIEAYLRQSPLFEISRAARKFESHLAQHLGEGLGLLEALVLVSVFFEKPLTVTPSCLAEAFSTTRGNISHCISSLEAKGLLGRKIDPQDARAYRLLLKPAGKRLAMQLIRTLDRMQSGFERAVGTKELEAALKAVRQVEEACSAMQPRDS